LYAVFAEKITNGCAAFTVFAAADGGRKAVEKAVKIGLWRGKIPVKPHNGGVFQKHRAAVKLWKVLWKW
jgi:hypothetical protein